MSGDYGLKYEFTVPARVLLRTVFNASPSDDAATISDILHGEAKKEHGLFGIVSTETRDGMTIATVDAKPLGLLCLNYEDTPPEGIEFVGDTRTLLSITRATSGDNPVTNFIVKEILGDGNKTREYLMAHAINMKNSVERREEAFRLLAKGIYP